MAVRLVGTVGFLGRMVASNGSGLLRCCSVNYDKIYSPDTRNCNSRDKVNSRSFSFDSLAHCSTLMFRFIAESELSAYTRDAFTFVHDATGLPWWFTIVLSGAALKIYSIPFRVYQIILMGKLEKIKNMDEIAKKVQVLVIQQQKVNMWTPEKAKRVFEAQMRRERKYLIEKHNCHPLKVILLGYFELPVWLYTSITWRTMSYGFSDDITSSNLLTAQMLAEGPFWCLNLTVPDPTYVLPTLVLLTQLAVVELGVIHADLLKREKTLLFTILGNLSRLLGVVGAIFCSYLPAAVSLFWISSMGFTFLREFIFISPKVRHILTLPYEPIAQKDVLIAFRKRLLKLVRFKGNK